VTAAAATVQAFFTERLARQRRASPHTIAAYRDTLRLLLAFAAERAATVPCRLGFADLTAPVITAFLDHCEQQRGNSIRTRNARLAAIHSLFGYAALRHPEHAADIERVLAIPPKRASQTIVTYLTDDEASALLAAPDRTTRTGRRDHAWILLAIQTGLRASELTGLTCGDVHLGHGAYIACHGKAAKTGSPHSPPAPSPPCGPGSPNAADNPPTRCLPPAAAGHSATTRCSSAWPPTPAKPPPPAPRWQPRRSPRTSCATPRPCACCTPGPTSPSSLFGSGTNRSPPPRSTCKPTWPSNSKPSTGPPR
jgi:Phage integrase, N-terminal SAM-like domain/Phage integrase family